MPSRKLTDRCPGCGCKNHLRARFCNQCGGKLDEDRAVRDADGRAKLHADIAHPINSSCREIVQGSILAAYREERERSKQPGYVCKYDEIDGDYEDTFSTLVAELNTSGHRAHPAHGPRGTHASRHDAPRPVAAHDDGDADGYSRAAM
jgi:stage V sporulation protein G